MMNDYLDPRNAVGMPDLADASFAMDFLLAVKTGVRYYSIALTETTSPEVRTVLRKQLNSAVELHSEITALMIEKEWLYPYDINAQQELDVKSAETALSIANLQLFPKETNRLGTFATPNN